MSIKPLRKRKGLHSFYDWVRNYYISTLTTQYLNRLACSM